LEEQALHITLWRYNFGRGSGSVVRQTRLYNDDDDDDDGDDCDYVHENRKIYGKVLWQCNMHDYLSLYIIPKIFTVTYT
jgi:hypothetical protein